MYEVRTIRDGRRLPHEDVVPRDESDRAPRSKVLHIITIFSVSSGAAENARLTVNLLPRDHFEVFLALPSGQTMEPHVETYVTRFHVAHLVRPIRLWRDVAAFVEIYRLCKKWRFDVVHTHNSKDGILGRWAAWLAGVPVIVHTIHNLAFRASRHDLVNRLYAWLERATARVTDALLAVSKEIVRDSLVHGIGLQTQYRVVYSGLELERYDVAVSQADARAQLGLPPAAALVGWFGRLNYQKDPLTFVRAARDVMEGFPNVHFIVCGDDPLAEDLTPAVHSLARELGIFDRMHFWGFRTDLPVVLRAVDVVMHSSRYEGMGRSLCEALLCDRPVAGTAVDGVREVIISGVRGGILVPPGQPAALAEAALALLRDRDNASALASAGRAWVKANLSATKMVRDIAEIYLLGLRSTQRRHDES